MSMLRAYSRAFTIRRLVNEIRCLMSYMLSRRNVRYFRHSPCFISVEPANFCQLSCPECHVGSHHRKTNEQHLLKPELLEAILDEIAEKTHTVQFFFQGEPTLNKQLPEFIAMANKHRMVTIVSTNAQAINREFAFRLVKAGLSKIIVSLDGLTQQTYELYRKGGKIQRVFDALEFFAEAKRQYNTHLQIELQCLLLKTNQHEWSAFKKQYRQLGATNLSFKTAQVTNTDNYATFVPENEKFARYRRLPDGTYQLRRRLSNRCLRLWRGAVITAEGHVLPCCFDKAELFPYGRLMLQQSTTNHSVEKQNYQSETSSSLLSVWLSDAAMSFRQRLLCSRKLISICQNCTG